MTLSLFLRHFQPTRCGTPQNTRKIGAQAKHKPRCDSHPASDPSESQAERTAERKGGREGRRPSSRKAGKAAKRVVPSTRASGENAGSLQADSRTLGSSGDVRSDADDIKG